MLAGLGKTWLGGREAGRWHGPQGPPAASPQVVTATWAETRGSVWCRTLGKKGLRNRCRHSLLFAALRKCGNNRLLAKGAGFQRLISGVQHSPPCLHSQTLLLTGVFLFFLLLHPGIFTLKSFLAGLPLDGAPCALTFLFLPSPASAWLLSPRETGLPSPPVAPSGASHSQTNVARPLTPDSNAHCQKEKRLSHFEMQQDRPGRCYKLFKRCPFR